MESELEMKVRVLEKKVLALEELICQRNEEGPSDWRAQFRAVKLLDEIRERLKAHTPGV